MEVKFMNTDYAGTPLQIIEKMSQDMEVEIWQKEIARMVTWARIDCSVPEKFFKSMENAGLLVIMRDDNANT